mmetsp:Transcript_331/g.707  ORF Transcript_331/g.707 Transcript_331/m.707 type:complete len:280 (-) Transcript_331:57-896(-)|eukprot:CAMPEP_0206437474 /NCGR_PEP_ID=MMETSP0324_2-20121206/11064_1 /ASSEMBLY_ACC=CAM_ASM_000836 /TAXON_ID=2866 /ORGANISM="Crypthecodinium cohnii, Strain Seligo" /LENGTH=279 /DNA_ID=CAMNT_0053904765 /DNA_START=19 /DNA_END=855 /DNA_ORIENTATION=+
MADLVISEAVRSIASEFQLSDKLLPNLQEAFDIQGKSKARALAGNPTALGKVCSTYEVSKRIGERQDLLSFLGEAPDESEVKHCHERLLFCGRYSGKTDKSLDEALEMAAAGLKAAHETAAAAGGRCRVEMTVRRGIFGAEHAQCRSLAFQYTPACSAGPGDSVWEARGKEGNLLGYLNLEGGGYIDDVSVHPAYQGQHVATALFAAADEEVCNGNLSDSLSLDVRAANSPALCFYEYLGFAFGPLRFPSFLDWDGGYSGQVPAGQIRTRKPPTATIEA